LQLSLPVSLPDDETFLSFYTLDNEFVSSYLQEFCSPHGTSQKTSQKALSYLFGSAGLGKSHLLYACCNEAQVNDVQSIYLDMLVLKDMPCALINEVADYGLICIDNLHAISGNSLWENAIFDLINQVIEKLHQPKLVIAANGAPNAAGYKLPDLVSRLNWGTVFQLANRSDADLGKIIQFRLDNRGIETTDESINFLLTRVDRDLGNLMMIVNELDKKSLQAKRRLTIPFMKQALGL
jgi:DnaA family protein